MAHSDQLGSITYEAETAGAFNPATGTGWGENVNTYTTLQVANLQPVDLSGLVHNKTTADFTEQYRGAGHSYVPMTMGGSFKTIHHLHGHGSTMVGSPSISANETLLGRVFGNVALSASASTTLTGGTVTAPTTTASATFSAGGLCKVGTLGDGDGDGQMYTLLSHVTTTLNLNVGLRGTPVNGAVLYPVVQFYTPSAPTTSALNGTRFEIMTANTQYRCHGCFPMSISISGLNPGETPRLEVTWGVSWWTDTGSTTFPTTVTQTRSLPAPVAAGSLHVGSVDGSGNVTATRNELTYRSFSIDYNLGVEPLKGPGGANQYQDIVGAVRTGNESCSISFTVDSSAAGTTTLADWGRLTTNVNRFIMLTLSTPDGASVGFKFPKVCSTSVPVQMRDGNINRVQFSGMAYTSDTLTSDLSRARMIMGWA